MEDIITKEPDKKGSELPHYFVKVDEVRNIGNPDNESPHPLLGAIKSLRKTVGERINAMELGYKAIADNRALVKTLQGRTFEIKEMTAVELLILGTEATWYVIVDKNGDVIFELRWNSNPKNNRQYVIKADWTDEQILAAKMPIDPIENFLRRFRYLPVCFSIACSKAEVKICDSLTLAADHATNLAREARKDLNDAMSTLESEEKAVERLQKELETKKSNTKDKKKAEN